MEQPPSDTADSDVNIPMEECAKEGDGEQKVPSASSDQAPDQEIGDEIEKDEESKDDAVQRGHSGQEDETEGNGEPGVGEPPKDSSIPEQTSRIGDESQMLPGEEKENPGTPVKHSAESDNGVSDSLSGKELPVPDKTGEEIQQEDPHDNSGEEKPSDDLTLPEKPEERGDSGSQVTTDAGNLEAVLEDEGNDGEEQHEQVVATISNEDERCESEEVGSTSAPGQQVLLDEEVEKEQEKDKEAVPSESYDGESKDAHEPQITHIAPGQSEQEPQEEATGDEGWCEDSLDEGKDGTEAVILPGKTEAESDQGWEGQDTEQETKVLSKESESLDSLQGHQETSESEKVDSVGAEMGAADNEGEKMEVTESAGEEQGEANTSLHLEGSVEKDTAESAAVKDQAVEGLSDTKVGNDDNLEEAGVHETSELEKEDQNSSDLVEQMDTSTGNVDVMDVNKANVHVVESATSEDQSRDAFQEHESQEAGVEVMEDEHLMETAVVHGQLEKDDTRELSKEMDRVVQDGKDGEVVDGEGEEPMDTSQDDDQVEMPAENMDLSGAGDVAKESEESSEANKENVPEVTPVTENIERTLISSDDNATPAPSDASNAEALVRGKESEGVSSVRVKQEILTDVIGEQEAERDVKPSRQELEKSVEQAQGREQQAEEGDAAGAQGKTGDGKKNKGSSITSIIGRLFTKKEEEARKMKEVCPFDPFTMQ